MPPRKIAVVTGTRAEYGILYRVLKAVKAHQGLELSLVVTGTHLSEEFGYTVKEIEKDGFDIDARIAMTPYSDSLEVMAESIGIGIIGMVEAWARLMPDIILVLGDRMEPLAATIAGAYMNIPVAHIHGGDTTGGNIDDSTRFAITKYAHIHFPATERSAQRIIDLGEEEWRVHMVGSPALDTILEALAESPGLDLSQPLVLVTQHPITIQADEASEQMRETLEAIVELGYQTVLIYPNSDAGSRKIIEVIKEYKDYPFIKTFKSLPRKEYLSLMFSASVIVGNSSSGIIDAPSFGLPAVNIGIRQEGRERGKNVIDAGHNKQEIIKAIKKALYDEEFLAEVRKCESPYGDGKASQRIADILAKVDITSELIQKGVTY